MICFCDIPLGNIKQHLEFYGHYGIGMKKQWGIDNGLTPILYLVSQSNIHKNLLSLINFEKPTNVHLNLMYQMKIYEGEIENNNEIKRFYDEKEWRFIPDENYLEDDKITNFRFKFLLSDFIGNDSVIREKINEILREERYKLHFHTIDIKYIIIKSEDERDEILDEIEDAKERINYYSRKDVRLLSSKILSTEQIYEDV